MTLRIITILILAASAAAGQSVDDLRWLEGTWQTEGSGAAYSETWEYRNGELHGKAATIIKSDTVDSEDLRITSLGGHLLYIAVPGSQAPTMFTFVKAGKASWLFANPEHDFPVEIEYQRRGEDAFTAVIRGPKPAAGKQREMRFELVRK